MRKRTKAILLNALRRASALKSRREDEARFNVVQGIKRDIAETTQAAVANAREKYAQSLGLKLVPATLIPTPAVWPPRHHRAFRWLAILAPKRVWNEDVGDAREVIAAMERAGCSPYQIRLKIVSTYFWVLIAVARELVAALTGRKSPHS